MRVIPPDDVFVSPDRLTRVRILHHVFIRLRLRVDARFRAFDREFEHVQHDEGVVLRVPLQHAHDFDIPTAFAVRRHLHQRQRGHLHPRT